MKRLVMLAVDAMDWDLMQALVDAGRMPCVAQLLGAGASGRMSVTPPTNAASVWTTVATGVMADRHALCHDYVVRADGITLTAPDRRAVRVPTLWDYAARGGWTTRVAGWPALLPAATDVCRSTENRMVAPGFDDGFDALAQCWPLAPDSAWPEFSRSEVQDARVYPHEVPAAAVRSLLGGLPVAVQQPCAEAARLLFSRWATVQSLGTRWLDTTNDLVLALRFGGLPGWIQGLLPHVGARLPDALAPWYAWLDLIVGRYMHLLGRSGYLVLVSDHGLPAGGYRGVPNLLETRATGGLLMVGPGVRPDSLLRDARSIDVCPTVLALLGIGADAATPMDGFDLLSPTSRTAGARCGGGAPTANAGDWRTAPESPCDEEAIAWLLEQGLPRIDIETMRTLVSTVDVAARSGKAAAQAARGLLEEAIEELSDLLSTWPDHLGVRLALGRSLIAAGRALACEALIAEAPAAAREGVWLHTFSALVAYAAEDWTTAEMHLQRLVDRGEAPFNAPAWLGWVRLAQDDQAGARAWFERSRTWPGEAVRVFEGLGVACLRLGEPTAAIEALAQAIASQPDNGRLHALRATALDAVGDRTGAQLARWRALALDPNLPDTLQSLSRAALDDV